MPVYKLLDEMTYEELLGWFDYFERRPPDWREDERAYRLMQAQGVKEPATSLFASLKKVYEGARRDVSKDGLDPTAFKGSMMFHKMMSAKGGDKLDL